MFRYKNTNYFLEQAVQNNSDLKKTFDALNDFISTFNSLPDEDKLKMTNIIPNTNQIYGVEFFQEAENILKELSNVSGYSPESQEFLKNNKEEAFKKINEFNNILKIYQKNYDNNFKSQFDSILGSSEYVVLPTDKTTPSDKKPSETTTKGTSSTTPTVSPKSEYVKGYTGVSIVDFLNQSGKPSDKEARKKLAVEQGIVNKPEEYVGTADQNTRLLNALRGGKVTSDDGVEVGKTELAKPYTTPKEGKGPTIKYGRMEYPAYVDMGGGKYRPAYQEELDNPNIQLYIPNPKKGASEYNKPNFVKVRREGSDIRPQSQFGGAAGSVSNFFGDIGRTLAGK